MRFKSFLARFAFLAFILVALVSVFLVPSATGSPDNVAPGTPEVVAIQADDNLVNTWGDDVTITFQVYDENGIDDVKSVEIWIKNEIGGTENYDNWPGGNIEAVKKISPYENEYSFTFNPDNSFRIGSATVKIRAIDNDGLENWVKEEDLFEVTDADISATTENADNITKSSATLHASIDLAGYDKVEARFYWENETDHKTWENSTSWENTSSTEYGVTIKGLEAYKHYEFMASIRLPENNPDSASQFDNGKVLKFNTFPENARVTTGSATDIERGNATLNASIQYGGYDNVDVIFCYRKEEGTWQNTGWVENYTSENYSFKLSGLPSGTVYEFYPRIRFGPSDNFFDNGSILTFNTGGVKIRTSHELEVEVDSEVDITVEVQNEYRDKELRNVVIEAQGNRYSDNLVTIDTIPADSTDSATFTYDPESSGEKNLQFSIAYRVYQDNAFLYSDSREVETSILVTGTEHENAIGLRVSDENPPLEWIFNGETFKAQIEVHNQRTVEVSGIRITNNMGRDYGVGTLEADESMTVQIQVPPENYEVGTNEVTLRAIHELGVSPPLTIRFGVRSENAPVGVFLVKSNSPIYSGQTLEFTLLVAGSTDSEAKDLVVEALSDNVIPTGYWVGEEMKNPTEEEVTEEEQMEALLTYMGMTQPAGVRTEEEEEERAVIGRKLYFEAKNLSRGDNALKFQVTYVLGEDVITREFEVDFEVRGTPGVMLIQKKPVVATKGKSVVISLEIANEMPIDIESVYVIPPENVEITPTARWVGDMEAGAYLPVDFQLQTQDIQDGDNLTFYAVYRIGDETHRSQPLAVTVKLTEPEEGSTPYYMVASIVLVAIFLLVYYWRRR